MVRIPPGEPGRWTLRELAGRAGMPPRTVRYYIARGLLDGPDKAGRAAAYGAGHLARLREIAARQRDGASLAEIAARLAAPDEEDFLPAGRRCVSLDLAPDVRVILDGGAAPWRMRRIRRALAEARKILESEKEGRT